MHKLCGRNMDPNHQHWGALLDEWMLTMQKYHLVSGDLPYWYNERANVGMLSAAAWRCGYVTLEEYPDAKRRSKADAEKKAIDERDFYGRVDLWIGRHGDDTGELIEAKLAWPKLSKRVDISLAIKEGLKQSHGAGKESKAGKGPTLGITFFVPEVKLNNGAIPADLDEQLQGLIDHVQALKIAVMAWYFPEQFRYQPFPQNDKYYPGVLLLGQRILRGA